MNDDDIEIYTDESRSEVLMTWHGLRMQTVRPVVDGVTRPNRCLGRLRRAEGLGARRTTSGCSRSPPASAPRRRSSSSSTTSDDYSAIMLKALADRLAEAFAERLHQRVRPDLWGYAPDEPLEQRRPHRGEVPGHPPGAGLSGLPGSPGQGRHVPRAPGRGHRHGASPRAWAMTPAASVSGFYLAHPEATYFNVGKIGDDQVRDLAARTGQDADRVGEALASLR